jgi:hypothetical protein
LTKTREWGVSKNIRLMMLLFWALNPIFPFQVVAVLKDNSSTALMMFFFVMYIDLIRDIRSGVKRGIKGHFLSLTGIVATGILAALFRHNNLYVVMISIVILLFLKQNARIRIAAAAAVFVLGANLISGILVGALDAERGSVAEALSIPFQQTARFVRYHPELVTPEERDAIDAVLIFDRLHVQYDPDLSDPVKNFFRGDTRALPAYFRHWFNMGLRRPVTYVSATIANSYYYYLPTKHTAAEWGSVWTHHNFGALDFHNIPHDTFSIADSHGQIQREVAADLYEMLRRTPGISVFFSLASYTWFIIFLMLFLVRKGGLQGIAAFSPALLVIAVCIASPVNGYVRYFLPVITVAPLLLAWVAHEASSATGPHERNPN